MGEDRPIFSPAEEMGILYRIDELPRVLDYKRDAADREICMQLQDLPDNHFLVRAYAEVKNKMSWPF
jgi:hypothetical protein